MRIKKFRNITLKRKIILLENFSFIKNSVFSANINSPVEAIRLYKKISCEFHFIWTTANNEHETICYDFHTKLTIQLEKKTLLQLIDSKFCNNFDDSYSTHFISFRKLFSTHEKSTFSQISYTPNRVLSISVISGWVASPFILMIFFRKSNFIDQLFTASGDVKT